MTIAQQNTAASVTISMDNSQNVNLWQPVQRVTAFFQRLGWHTKGYGTIFSIMFLALMSLIFLSIHWSYRKLLIVPTQQDELDLESSK